MRAGSNSCIVLRGHSHQSHTGRGQWVGGGWVGGGGQNQFFPTAYIPPPLFVCSILFSKSTYIVCEACQEICKQQFAIICNVYIFCADSNLFCTESGSKFPGQTDPDKKEFSVQLNLY